MHPLRIAQAMELEMEEETTHLYQLPKKTLLRLWKGVNENFDMGFGVCSDGESFYWVYSLGRNYVEEGIDGCS